MSHSSREVRQLKIVLEDDSRDSLLLTRNFLEGRDTRKMFVASLRVCVSHAFSLFRMSGFTVELSSLSPTITSPIREGHKKLFKKVFHLDKLELFLNFSACR